MELVLPGGPSRQGRLEAITSRPLLLAAVGKAASHANPTTLMAWGDAFLTGIFCAIFVAFVLQWLVTWSDQRYLRRPA